ncbi:MAG: hypothetical protein ACE149_05820 [Armatimonadota bacterium]
MASFPRTEVGGISVPRLVCGSNWMLGYSHQTKARDQFIKELFDTPQKIADVVEVFARAGCNAFMSMTTEFVRQALDEVEQRTGVEMIWFATPSYAEWGKPDTWKSQVELSKRMRAQFCFPHTTVVDPLLDKVNRRFDPLLVDHLRVVREFGMIPGLSTHSPEAIICSDESNADVATYIQPYNAAGFLCHVETDWVQRIIRNAKKPVLTIKPMAAGRLQPLPGLSFVWNTLRDCDMVTVGTMSTYEAEEVIEISLACLEGREPNVDLQFTRSKRSVVVQQPS